MSSTPRVHNFGQAIQFMKAGHRVARLGWNGKGMYVYLVPGAEKFLPYIAMKTAQDTVVPWLASQSDMLADDWIVWAGKSAENDTD